MIESCPYAQCIVYPDSGEVCISILVSGLQALIYEKRSEMVGWAKHPPVEDIYGYEDAGERWLPVHTVESIVRSRTSSSQDTYIRYPFVIVAKRHLPSLIGHAEL